MPYGRRRSHGVMSNRPIGRHRILDWATLQQADNTVANGVNTAHDAIADWRVAGASVLGVTVIRTILTGAVAFANVADFVQLGIIVMPVASGGAILDPNNNPEEDWMLNTRIYPGASAAVVDATTPFHFDLRSKRKIPERQSTLWICWKPVTTGGTTSLTVLQRTLLMLP